MPKKNEGKNRANKALHTKLLKRKKKKQQEAKDLRKQRLKEIYSAAKTKDGDE